MRHFKKIFLGCLARVLVQLYALPGSGVLPGPWSSREVFMRYLGGGFLTWERWPVLQLVAR